MFWQTMNLDKLSTIIWNNLQRTKTHGLSIILANISVYLMWHINMINCLFMLQLDYKLSTCWIFTVNEYNQNVFIATLSLVLFVIAGIRENLIRNFQQRNNWGCYNKKDFLGTFTSKVLQENGDFWKTFEVQVGLSFIYKLNLILSQTMEIVVARVRGNENVNSV